MKAAVLFPGGSDLRYVDFPEPVIRKPGERMILVKAAAIKHLDRSRARGQHYSVQQDIREARVIGGDGVGLLEDGRRVYALGEGMVAEKALVDEDRIVVVPDGLDDVTAAALPNAVIGSAMALRFRAVLKPGETVLINGATGFTGKIAVQLARHYGARRVVATGRNEQALRSLTDLGADELVLLTADETAFVDRLKTIHDKMPFDVIIDYLWGHPAEWILSAIKGKGSFSHRTRFVSVGAVTGDELRLSAAILRSVDLQLNGSGLGSWSREQVRQLFSEMLPEAFQLAVDNKLKVDTLSVNLKDIEKIGELNVSGGKRLVVVM